MTITALSTLFRCIKRVLRCILKIMQCLEWLEFSRTLQNDRISLWRVPHGVDINIGMHIVDTTDGLYDFFLYKVIRDHLSTPGCVGCSSMGIFGDSWFEIRYVKFLYNSSGQQVRYRQDYGMSEWFQVLAYILSIIESVYGWFVAVQQSFIWTDWQNLESIKTGHYGVMFLVPHWTAIWFRHLKLCVDRSFHM